MEPAAVAQQQHEYALPSTDSDVSLTPVALVVHVTPAERVARFATRFLLIAVTHTWTTTETWPESALAVLTKSGPVVCASSLPTELVSSS